MESLITIIKNFFSDDNNLNNWLKKVVFNIRYTQQKIYPIRKFSDGHNFKIKTLIPPNKTENYFPKIFGKEQSRTSTRSPEIGLFFFKNAIVNINSSSILKNRKVFVDYCQAERFNEGHIVAHSEKNAKIKFEKPIEIEDGFFLGGNGTWNWYHFMIEIMPKILFLPQVCTKKILVSEKVAQIKNMKRVLEIAAPDVELIYLNSNLSYKINNLYHINDFNHIPFNNHAGNDINTSRGYFNKAVTTDFTDKIIAGIKRTNQKLPKRFYIKRTTHRIAGNESEVQHLLKNYDIEIIDLMAYTLDQQVALFQSAELIVGITGAGWTNLMFCRNNPHAICFLPDNAKSFTAFANIAECFNATLYHIFYESDANHYDSGFILPLNELESLLNEFDK